MNKISLLDRLTELSKSDQYPFHMPGHKRRFEQFPFPYSIDITEIEGFDNLHHAQGILKEYQDEAASIYGSLKSYYLVNGSTCGILAAIHAGTARGDKIIMGRNAHKSAFHGVFLNDLNVIYSYPQTHNDFDMDGGLLLSEIQSLLTTHRDVSMVYITSPTYEGVVSDIKAIAECVHSYGIPLIVDEAHGAHLPFGRDFPESALSLGADIVIQSLHKTLPALTQTAILHVNSDRIDIEKLERYLSIFQTSSPSYVFMASIQHCISYMHKFGNRDMEMLYKNLQIFYDETKNLKNIEVIDSNISGSYGIFDRDISKIVISVKGTNISGVALSEELLLKYNIQMEMSLTPYALALTSCMDSPEGFSRLSNALTEIDKTIESREKAGTHNSAVRAVRKMTIYEAVSARTDCVDINHGTGKISAEYIYAYPPGRPLIVPGEVIDEMMVQQIRDMKKCGISVQGTFDKKLEKIRIVRE